MCNGDLLCTGCNGSHMWNTNETTSFIHVEKSGTYSVVVTDNNGCISSDDVNISVNPLPTVDLGDDQEICENSNIILNADNSGATFLWSTDEITQEISANESGKYWVKVTNENGCTASDELEINVIPNPIVDLGEDREICENNSITLDAGNPDANYLWNTNAVTQFIKVSEPGDYWVQVTNAKGCSAIGTIWKLK